MRLGTRRSFALAGVILLSLPFFTQAGDHPWLERFAQRTPYPCRPIDHSAERAGTPLTVSRLAAPSMTRSDGAGYIGGASIRNNNLSARGPCSAVGPIYDGTFGTDYTGVRQHMGRVFLAPSSDASVGRPIYLGYVAEGRRVTDIFALRPFRKAVLEKKEEAEERKHGKEGHGEGGHGEAGHAPEAGHGAEGGMKEGGH
jgi:hypothetical protein